MTPSSVLVMFVSGWGVDLPIMADLVSSYPLAMLQPSAGGLGETYKILGAAGAPLASIIAEKAIAEVRIADPDRFGLLTQAFDGGSAISHTQRRDIYVPFPPGMTIGDAYESTLALQKKQVLAALDEGKSTVIFAAFSTVWSISMLREPQVLRAAAEKLSATIEVITAAALEAQIPVLICSDTARMAGKSGGEGLLPCLLVHEQVEGLRASPADRADMRELPLRATASVEQVGATIAALLQAPVSSGAQQPLFGSFLPRLRTRL